MLSGGVAQNVLSFTPPFIINEAEIDYALEQLAGDAILNDSRTANQNKSSLISSKINS